MSSSSSCSTEQEGINEIRITYTWTVPCDSIKNYLYEDDDYYYESDDYQDDVKIESPSFGPDYDNDRFVLKLYPRSTEGCSDCGSLVIQLKSYKEDALKLNRFKISISSFSRHDEKCIEGICRKSSLLSQSLGWRDTFRWKKWIKNSSHFIIYCEISFCENETEKNIIVAGGYYHHQRLSQDFGSLRSRSRYSDVLLCTADGKEYPAHKAILSARSSVFDAMFSHEEFQENQEKRVLINDISSEIMDPFLNYIYGGDTSSVHRFALELLAVADKYDVQSLIKLCVQSMFDQIEIQTASKLFYTANLYQLSELKQQAMNFINQNPIKIMETEGWKTFIKPHSELMEELYRNLANQVVTIRFH